MARMSKNLKNILEVSSGRGEWGTLWESFSAKEKSRLAKEIVRETNRALKKATTYTKKQFAERGTRVNKNVAKIYKSEDRMKREIERSITVLRTEKTIKELQKTKNLTAREASWESMLEDNYFRQFVSEFETEAGIKLTEAQFDRLFTAYERSKHDLKLKKAEQYYKLAKEIFDAWRIDKRRGWDALRTIAYNKGSSYYYDSRDVTESDDVY